MVAWFIIAISTIGILAFVAANGVAMVSSVSDASQRIETVRRLDAAKAAIEARMSSDGVTGLLLMPVGIQGSTSEGYGAPNLPVPTITPFGRKFVYCPFGPAAGGAGTTITSANLSTYDVSTANGFVTGGRPAYARLSVDPDLMGYLMALRGKTGTQPSCGNVTFNTGTGKFEAPDSIVRPISRAIGVDQVRNQNNREVLFYVSNTGLDTASGATSADPTSVSRVMAYITANKPNVATVRFLSGSYVSTDSAIFRFATGQADMKGSGRLTLEGLGSAGSVRFDSAPGTLVQLYGDIFIKNINFNANTALFCSYGFSCKLFNSQIGPITGWNSKILMNNVAVKAPAGYTSYTMNLWKSDVDIDGNIDIYVDGGLSGMVLFSGSTVRIGGANLRFFDNTPGDGVLPDSYINLRSNSRFTQDAGTITFVNPANVALYTMGSVELSAVVTGTGSGASNVLAFIETGGELKLLGSTLGSFGSRATLGLGAAPGSRLSVIAGGTVSGTQCWSGQMFAYSGSATTNGSSSAVTPDGVVPVLRATPTGPETQAYVIAQRQNAERAALRQVNAGALSCVI